MVQQVSERAQAERCGCGPGASEGACRCGEACQCGPVCACPAVSANASASNGRAASGCCGGGQRR